ncbi:hypothetical protein [Hymenobacter sp. PAMC 26628]|uniref:hypothetical protein n=1 Tax=Hymenobacter sp. PAMC 26628 TaxID=1484118 RepID=UPI00076FEF0B|nr:hypothetical protein [Hymenobacter sp. PAMC 26628]AMJ64797.1 hypothetical protein AXW84_04620 [Hymenobacter sp. PAMC 26628]
MELDDLRRQWQQPAPPGPALDAGQLSSWLARGSGGLVARMRRNTHWEQAFTALVMVGAAVLWASSTQLIYRFYAVVLLGLGLGMFYYYYRVLAVLGQMAAADGHLRGHLQRLSAGLRQLLRFNFRLTLAMGPLALFSLLGYAVGRELARPGGFRSGRVLVVGGVLLALGALLQLAVAHLTRRYLHQLYGRHLDRLDANLRELDEPGLGA